MTFDLCEIKRIRKSLGITQKKLADLAGVSQSLIAKTEAGMLDPAYSKATKIFEALNEINKRSDKKAVDVMEKRIISVKPDDTVKDAVSKMKKYGISQMPVIENQNVIGTISESILLDAFVNRKSESLVKNIMKDAPPIIPKNASKEAISELLRFSPMLLVSEMGVPVGIITKSDMIIKAYRK